MAGGWRAACSSLCAAMPMHDAIHELQSHNHMFPGNRCSACKQIPELCYTNGAMNAGWRRTAVTHEQWLRGWGACRFAIVNIPGWRLELLTWVCMHGLQLGLVQVCGGNTIWELAHEVCGNIEQNLIDLGHDVQHWCRTLSMLQQLPTTGQCTDCVGVRSVALFKRVF